MGERANAPDIPLVLSRGPFELYVGAPIEKRPPKRETAGDEPAATMNLHVGDDNDDA